MMGSAISAMEVQLWSLGTAQHGTQPAEKEEMEDNQKFGKAGDLMDGPSAGGVRHHFTHDLYTDLPGELLEGRDLVEPQSKFILSRIFGAHASDSIAHGRVYFGGCGGIKTFGDDHAVICPVLNEYRSFFRHDLGTRYRALRFAARGRGMLRHRLIALGKRGDIKAGEAFGGLGRRPSRNIEERQVGRGRGCFGRSFVLVFVFVSALESYVRPTLPGGRYIVGDSALAVLFQKGPDVELSNASRVVDVILLAEQLLQVRHTQRRQLFRLDVSLRLQHFMRILWRACESAGKRHFSSALVEQLAFKNQTFIVGKRSRLAQNHGGIVQHL